MIVAALGRAAEERLATLKVGSEVYTNVTVTSVTATHLYFDHSRGMGLAKLAELEPAMQRHFRFDPAKAAAKQAELAQGNALYRKALREVPPPKKPAEPALAESPQPASEIPPHPIYAKSFLNRPAPELTVETWLTGVPDFAGKFVLLDFWATWCGPCRRSIPQLNTLYAKFKDRLLIIGLSDEPEQVIRRMTQPKIEYAIASDTQARTLKTVEVRGIPHTMLIDARGIVRFEGNPHYLSEKGLERLLDRYAK